MLIMRCNNNVSSARDRIGEYEQAEVTPVVPHIARGNIGICSRTNLFTAQSQLKSVAVRNVASNLQTEITSPIGFFTSQ